MNTVLGFRQEPTELLIGFEYCNIFVHLLCAALEPAEHAMKCFGSAFPHARVNDLMMVWDECQPNDMLEWFTMTVDNDKMVN